MLTRSRGGLILDKSGEIYHLLHLCRRCHSYAHSAEGRHLMISGYVITGPDKEPIYVGEDEYLNEHYGFDAIRESEGPHPDALA